MNRKTPALDRRRVAAEILNRRGDALVVAGLGAPTWDTAAAGDHALNFYTWGGMGGAAMIGLGLALAQPKRRVLVITGDGELLMGLGSLATIAVQQPRNLAIIVIDNERYGETGMQDTHTRFGVDLAGMAKAAGFRTAGTIYTASQLKTWIPRLHRNAGPM
ncbi:MAG: thiamine pyrophosphate-dependent enzyme, partial [Burkholderiales bacterium]